MEERDAKQVSVAMAVYNGEKYIREQINSILIQLRENDELIISYNESTDATWSIIKEYEMADKRVKCFVCSQNGVISNFNNAIAQTTGEIVFLADQDDIWYPDKLRIILSEFEKNEKTMLIMHNCNYVDAEKKSLESNLYEFRNAKPGFLKNVLVNSYQGSCMAFRREVIYCACPVPENVVMHDQWLGLCAEVIGKVAFINECLMDYRLHDANASFERRGLDKVGGKVKEVLTFCRIFMWWRKMIRKGEH